MPHSARTDRSDAVIRGDNNLLEIVDSGTITELITLGQVRDWLDEPDTSHNSTLESLIVAARELFEKRYNLTLAERERKFFYATYASELELPNRPHTSIDTIEQQDNEGDLELWVLGDEYTLFGTSLLRFCQRGIDLIITTTSGYTTLPKDIERATLMQIKFMFDGEWDNDERISPEVEKIMRRYDREVLV